MSEFLTPPNPNSEIEPNNPAVEISYSDGIPGLNQLLQEAEPGKQYSEVTPSLLRALTRWMSDAGTNNGN